MRILVISNYYPPSRYGWGHMQLCEQVTDGLSAQGHTIAVLTSTYRDGLELTRPYPVWRRLALDPDWHCGTSVAWQFFVGRRQRERQAVEALHQAVGEFEPDVIFVWHYRYLSRVLLQEAERLSSAVLVYYMADYVPRVPDEHLDFWRAEPVHWTARLLKQPMAKVATAILAREGKPIKLRYDNVICVSDYLRSQLVSEGLISPNAVGIHNGVDIGRFSLADGGTPIEPGTGLRCLIAGRLVADKGIHTAIESLVYLDPRPQQLPISLTILGDGPSGYRRHLETLVTDHGLQDRVKFRAPVPRDQMPQILSSHNALLLPSEYAEPLARAMQEAMAMGLLVVGTTTGGSGELLVHDRTGFAFEPGNPESLAAQLSRAVQEPALAARLAKEGQRTVQEQFTIDRTIERTADHLMSLVEGKNAKND